MPFYVLKASSEETRQVIILQNGYPKLITYMESKLDFPKHMAHD